ncbi:AsmA family protein [Sideroxydans lithotrophicus]|uniref:AsmA family protein n=1 Tax=Sideroxydans lithotrophicus (strain ES-1) TaxID=580332 RepID=D5CM53_SIDLE|nr:AsmA family protein [Sideroxydans lithotrophicus]ADE10667.1 AsmA family protein [Sideroxydans lithotrophicus ES-1]
MNKYLKYGLWSIAVVVAVAAGMIVYIAATFDPNAYKPQIIQAVKDSKHRTLKLDGDIKLHFFPSIGASLGKVSLSEFESEQEFISVDSASVSLKLLPLLARQIVVDEVDVSGVKAQLVKYKNGKTNIDDLIGKEEATPAAPTPPAAASGAPMQFDIASVQVAKTDLSYSDEATGASYSVKDLNLKTGRIANDTPSKIDFSAHLQSSKPKLDIVAQIKTTLTFDLEKNLFQVQGLDMQANGNALDITDLHVQAGGDASARVATKEYSMKKFTLSASGAKGKSKDKFEAKLDVPELSLAKDKFTGNGVTLNAKLDGAPGSIVAVLELPGIEGNASSFKVSAMVLDAELKQPDQTFKLKLTSPVTGSIEAQQFNLSDLTLAVNATGDKLPGKSINSQLKGSFQADLGRQSIQGNLAGGLLQSQIKAKLAVNNFNVPMIRYDLEVDQFDADPYLPPKTVTAKEPGPAGGKAEPEQPFDLSALKTLNVEGSVRIGSLKAANVKVAQLRVDVKARNGQVNIAPLSAKLYQGSIDGKASLNAASYDFAINEKLTGVDVAPLLKDAADLDLAEGRGNISFDLTTHGNTVGGLKKALNGKASVDLANGAIKGINLEKLVQGIQSLGKDTRMQTLGVDKSEKTPFNEFKATFKIRNGVAHNDDLAVKSTVLRVTGKGDIDIGHDNLDYNAKAIFAKTEQGKTATLPVNVSGAFDNLKFKVDYGALIADVARQKIDEKKEQVKEEAKTKLQEELKKGLKGLFK